MVTVEYEARYAADAEVVLALLVDEAFLAAYAKEIGATSWDVAVDRSPDMARTRLRMDVPTAGVPPAFKRFVTPSVEIIEVRTWSSAAAGAARRGRVAVDTTVGRRDARVRGDLLLAAIPEGTRFSVAGDIRVNVPLVGDLAATLLKDLVVTVLNGQTRVLERRLPQ